MDTLWSSLWWIIKLYIPPKDGDPVHLFRYHVAQSVGILGIWTLAWLSAFWLWGGFPAWTPQLAWAADLQPIASKIDLNTKENRRVETKLNQIILLQVRASLSTAVKDACLAQRAKNQGDLDNANGQLQVLGDEYYQLSGRPYLAPSCSTVLVDAK